MRATSALVVLLMCASLLAQTPVRVRPEQRMQRMDGIGGGVSEQVVRELYRSPQRERVFALLFADLKPQVLRIDNCLGRENADYTIRVCYSPLIKQARQLVGRDVDVLITATSPPVRLKSNGMLEGGTLVQRAGTFDYAGFAQWWEISLRQYQAAGIWPAYLSIQSEPDVAARRASCRLLEREMMRDGLLCASYPAALAAVDRRMAGRAGAPVLIGPEIAGIDRETMQRYGDQMQAAKPYALAHHLDDGGLFDAPESGVPAMRDIYAYAKRGQLPLFQTACARPTPDADAYREAMNLALIIHHSLVDEQVGVFLYGDLADRGGKGLVSTENPDNVRPIFHAFGHYSRFIAKGDIRIGVAAPETIRAAAFQAADASTTSVILINPGTAEVEISIPGNAKRIVQTTKSALGGALTELKVLPPQSITSVQW